MENMKSVHNILVSRSNSPKHSYIQPVYQNLSGSDTDVSTSTENLTVEEKRVLLNGVRQEPQGEETIVGGDLLPLNTLIIHDKGDPNSSFYSQNFCVPVKKLEKSYYPPSDVEQLEKYKMSSYSETESGTPAPLSSPKSSVLRPMYPGQQVWEGYSPGEYMICPNQPPGAYHLLSPSNYPEQAPVEIPKDYLDQSEVLKYLAKELNHQSVLSDVGSYAPEYPKQVNDHCQVILGNARRRGMLNARSKSADRLTVTRSQPDLSHTKNYHSEDNSNKSIHAIHRPETRGRAAFGADSDVAFQQTNQMIELLSAENTALKTELDLYYKKVSKLQKFELEIQKVHKAYEDLVQSSEKRERLERSIRSRMEMEIRRLQEHNKQLRDHLDYGSSQFSKSGFYISSETTDADLRKELSKREVLISQLLTQSKELLAEKDRQEIELQAQRATLQEQRNHIDILDNALTNAQANVVRLEEESRKKQIYVDRVSQLQKALTNLQQSSEKRLLVEKKLRTQHEKEIQALRAQIEGRSSSVSKNESPESNESLKKTIMDYEDKIMALESEVSKWEQRYMHESAMRQFAVDAASVPKDAKIAALEKTSQESEKLIAQARVEKLKHMDELYAANRKCTELESRIKDMESKLAEKDAMIKVLQQHSQDKDTVFENCVLGRPPRHTRAASTVGLTTSTCHTTTTTGVSSLGRVSPSPTNTLHRRTGSASGSLLSISSESSSTALPSQSSPVTESVTAAKKSLDEQLKELDSRLSRLNHKRSTSRERKVSKSLLESMKEMICN